MEKRGEEKEEEEEDGESVCPSAAAALQRTVGRSDQEKYGYNNSWAHTQLAIGRRRRRHSLITSRGKTR